MLDPIEHRRRQIENMNKAFSDNNEIEKAWKIGDEKQYQGATWVVGGFNAKGTPLWRKKKDGGSGTAPAQTPASNNSPANVGDSVNVSGRVHPMKIVKIKRDSTVDSQGNVIKLKDFNNVSADRLKRIQGFLQTKDPDNPNNQRILEDDGMDDDRLADLQAVAERNMSNYGLNDKTREYCRKWNDLALAEINRRNKERKGGGKKTFSIKNLVDKMAAAAKDPIQVDTSNPKSMTDAVKEMFKRMGLDNKVEVGRSPYRSFYKFYLDGDVCSECRYHQDKTLSFLDFCISANECIASAIVKNENMKGNNEITIKNLVAIKGPNWKQK